MSPTEGGTASALGLYVHVPFCAAICNYCNFARGLYDEALKDRYLQAVRAEIASADTGPTPRDADTVYFGGGTPSLLSGGEVGSIIQACARAFTLAADVEVTLEANPESLSPARLQELRAAGVNRLSLGVQSWDAAMLRRLDRQHDPSRAQAALGWAREAGFENVSLDLMMALPGQTLRQWLETLERTVALDPDHLSVYLLEMYPHAPLAAVMTAHGLGAVDDDEAADMYEQGMAFLEAAGYEQYEISNLARKGRRSRHNLKYWTDGAWVGFGPAAHSTLDRDRWCNVPGAETYVERVSQGGGAVAERLVRTMDDRAREALFMGLRTRDGVDLHDVAARYGVDAWEEFGPALAPHVEAGRLERHGSVMRLTRTGMQVSHEVMCVFV